MRFIMIFSGLFECPGSARRRVGAGTGADDGAGHYRRFKDNKNHIANAPNLEYVA